MRILNFLRNVCIFLCFSLSGVIFGLDSGSVSDGFLFFTEFRSKYGDLNSNLNLAFNAGGLIGSVAFLFLQMVRRIVPFLLGDAAILVGCGVLFVGNDVSTFTTGRIIMGAGIGVVCLAGPLSVVDSFPAKYQSRILALGNVSMQLGLYAAYLIAIFDWLSWKNLFVLLAIVAIVQGAFSLSSYQNKDATEKSFKVQVIEFVSQKNFRNVILPAVLVQCCHVSVGYPIIFSEAESYLNADVLMGAAIISAFISIIMIQVLKRKLLVICSVTVIILILGLLALNPPKPGDTLAEFLFLAYLVIYISSLANTPVIYAFELFPEKLKGLGIGFIGVINWVLIILLSIVAETKKLTPRGLWTCIFLSAVSVTLCGFFMLETHPKPPEDKEDDKKEDKEEEEDKKEDKEEDKKEVAA